MWSPQCVKGESHLPPMLPSLVPWKRDEKFTEAIQVSSFETTRSLLKGFSCWHGALALSSPSFPVFAQRKRRDKHVHIATLKWRGELRRMSTKWRRRKVREHRKEGIKWKEQGRVWWGKELHNRKKVNQDKVNYDKEKCGKKNSRWKMTLERNKGRWGSRKKIVRTKAIANNKRRYRKDWRRNE
jgi:hypothetical protein